VEVLDPSLGRRNWAGEGAAASAVGAEIAIEVDPWSGSAQQHPSLARWISCQACRPDQPTSPQPALPGFGKGWEQLSMLIYPVSLEQHIVSLSGDRRVQPRLTRRFKRVYCYMVATVSFLLFTQDKEIHPRYP
jgi:hypothetical protein